ncbi:MAG: AraC family transcriptional regulator [Eubacteriales bacterium]|nr:AraC family transcriptional regulator [Eubacteriales bacterium]
MHIQYSTQALMPQAMDVVLPDGHKEKQKPSGESKSLQLPKTVLDGTVVTTELCPGMLLTISDFTPEQDTSFAETYAGQEVFQLSFCLNGLAEWTYQKEDDSTPAQRFWLSAQHSQIRLGPVWHCRSTFYGGIRFRGISITLDPQKYADVLHRVRAKQALCDIGGAEDGRVYPFHAQIGQILQEIIDCPMEEGLRQLYWQGKILELLALYCDRVICRTPASRYGGELASRDYEALLLVRDMIDTRYAEPLTIALLAHEALINENLLKQGFRRCFGCTVNEYLVECRMQAAHTLLQSGRYKVGEVAWAVGYAHTGYFIRQFHTRFGLTPGEFLHGIR